MTALSQKGLKCAIMQFSIKILSGRYNIGSHEYKADPTSQYA